MKLTPYRPLKLKQFREDLIPGGLADDKPDENFDAEQMKAGMKVEMEHTNDPNIAKEIAKDHLTEDPDYYKKLATIEEAKRDNEVSEKSLIDEGDHYELDLHNLIGAGILFTNKPPREFWVKFKNKLVHFQKAGFGENDVRIYKPSISNSKPIWVV